MVLNNTPQVTGSIPVLKTPKGTFDWVAQLVRAFGC